LEEEESSEHAVSFGAEGTRVVAKSAATSGHQDLIVSGKKAAE
jgi:hypothetical protein